MARVSSRLLPWLFCLLDCLVLFILGFQEQKPAARFFVWHALPKDGPHRDMLQNLGPVVKTHEENGHQPRPGCLLQAARPRVFFVR